MVLSVIAKSYYNRLYRRNQGGRLSTDFCTRKFVLTPMKEMTIRISQQLKIGMLEAIPISISTFIFGSIFGVVAIQSGLSILESSLMSFISFAGAAQLSVLQLIGQASLWTIFFTTFLLNARHLLYELSLSIHVQHEKNRKKNLIAFLLSDSMFALANNRLKTEVASMGYFIGVGIVVYAAWGLGTLIGASFTQLLPSNKTYGLEFAGTACFIILLTAEVTTIRRMLACLLCALFVISVASFLPTGVLLLFTGLLAFSIGYFSNEDV